jgi:m7GpppX diphosphatase
MEIYRFIMEEPDIENIRILEKKSSNNNYSKYEVEAKVKGEMIVSANTTTDFQRPANIYLVEETYEDYLEILKTIPLKNYQWVYNIIDGLTEQEDIVYSDDKFILIPTYTWNYKNKDKKNMDKIHILAIFKDKNLKTLRSLTGENADLLEYVMNKSLDEIERIYNIPKNRFRAYFHYHPSAWQLHIHFNLIDNRKANCVCEHSHDVNQVIFNLRLCSDYYQKIKLKRVFGEVD